MNRKLLNWTIGAALAALPSIFLAPPAAQALPQSPVLTLGFSETGQVNNTSLTNIIPLVNNQTGSFSYGPAGQGTDCAMSVGASAYHGVAGTTLPDLLTNTLDVSCGLTSNVAGTHEIFHIFISESNVSLSSVFGMPYVPYNTLLHLNVQNGATTFSMQVGTTGTNQTLTETVGIDTGNCWYYLEQSNVSGCGLTNIETYTQSGAGGSGTPQTVAASTTIADAIFETSSAACTTALLSAPVGTECFVDTDGLFNVTMEYTIDVTLTGTNDQSKISTGLDLTWPPDTVPEPSSLALLGAGLIGMGWFSRRKKTS